VIYARIEPISIRKGRKNMDEIDIFPKGKQYKVNLHAHTNASDGKF